VFLSRSILNIINLDYLNQQTKHCSALLVLYSALFLILSKNLLIYYIRYIDVISTGQILIILIYWLNQTLWVFRSNEVSYVLVSPYAKSSMSVSSSTIGSSLSYTLSSNIRWQVEQARVPSHAPNTHTHTHTVLYIYKILPKNCQSINKDTFLM